MAALARGETRRRAPKVATALYNLANLRHAQGRLAEAETLHREALTMQKKLLDPAHREIADSLHDLAGVLLEQSRLSEAKTLFRKVLQSQRARLPADDLELADTLTGLADTLLAGKRFAEAEPPARECLAIWEKKIRLQETLQRLVQLYESWDKSGPAAK